MAAFALVMMNTFFLCYGLAIPVACALFAWRWHRMGGFGQWYAGHIASFQSRRELYMFSFKFLLFMPIFVAFTEIGTLAYRAARWRSAAKRAGLEPAKAVAAGESDRQ